MRFVALALALTGTPAAACAVWVDFAVEDIAGAPVVVRATVQDYATDRQGGLMDLAVTEVLKGEAPGQLVALWPFGMSGTPPDRWNRPPEIIAALTPEGGGFLLVVPICSEAHLVADTEENRARLAAALGR